MSYKHILVAVDGSKTSFSALQEAIHLAQDQHSVLRIIHVVDERHNFDDSPVYYDRTCDALMNEGQAILDKMAAMAREHQIKTECRIIELKPLEGRIEDKIIEASQKWPADLLVIGTHGRSGFSRLFFGSVAQHVLLMATIPILLIRGKLDDS